MTKKKDSPIALELERYEKKIKQFQDYLDDDLRDINTISDDATRHKEITVQQGLMKDLGFMLSQLASLREQEEKLIQTRGDVTLNRKMRREYGDNE